MADTHQVDEAATDDGATAARDSGRWSAEGWRAARDARTVTRLAREISAFAGAHGGAEGHVAYLGRKGARIVLVGADGHWGDLVAPSDAVARQAAEKSGLTVHEAFSGELAARVRTGPYEWSRMAGIQLGGARTAP